MRLLPKLQQKCRFHNIELVDYTKLRDMWLCIKCWIQHPRLYHWRIQGGGAAAPPPPPQQDQFLSFLHVFTEKCTRRRLAPPQREILDPPLFMST